MSNVKSLNILAAEVVTQCLPKLRPRLDELNERILFDIIYQLYLQIKTSTDFRLQVVMYNMLTFPTFAKLLRVGDKRSSLHKILQAAVDMHKQLPSKLAEAFCRDQVAKLPGGHRNLRMSIYKYLQLGSNLGEFFCEAGWYPASSEVHRTCVNILRRLNPRSISPFSSTRLLNSLINDCQFSEASWQAGKLARYIHDERPTTSTDPTLAYTYSVLSHYNFMKSNYHVAFAWAMESVKLLTLSLPPKLTVDVLRQASKACVRNKEFAKAEILLKQAVGISKTIFGDTHAKYADSLIDYGFYLLCVGRLTACLQAYQKALTVRKTCFGGDNLQVALAHMELASLPIFSSTIFSDADRHAERSLSIMEKLLPSNHLYVAFSKRVLAIILNRNHDEALLKKSEELHKFSFKLIRHNFGEFNAQTALSYENLGSLYCHMRRYEDSERMFLRALEIQEKVLGMKDPEVGNSLYLLSTLYCIKNQYLKAEKLCLRAIEIFKNLFGPTCPRLGQPYERMIEVYEKLPDQDKCQEYRDMLEEWWILRSAAEQSVEVSEEGHILPLSELIKTVNCQ